jgi:hypothetical protein
MEAHQTLLSVEQKEEAMMANRRGPTVVKRDKERARQQKQRDKTARRLEVRRQKVQAGPRTVGGEDPDLAGIRPGPQPLPQQWGVEPETSSAPNA